MGKEKVKISIIVPCFNMARYVERCIHSLTHQTLRDIEIICINDASTDDTLAVLNKCAHNDSRIRVISLDKNVGVSTARNIGIKNAHGVYVGFVDGDDYVDVDFYENLYNSSENESIEIVKGRLRRFVGNYVLYDGHDAAKGNKYEFKYCFTSAIYNREMLITNNIFFPDGIAVAEDIFFLMRAVYFAARVRVIDCGFYNYVRRTDSVDSGVYSHAKIMDALSVADNLMAWLNTTKDISEMNMAILYRRVLDVCTNLFPLTGADVSMRNIAAAIIHLYQISARPVVWSRILSRKQLRAISGKDIVDVICAFNTKTTRGRLFGCVPFITVHHTPVYQTRVYLWRYIPLYGIRRGDKTTITLFNIPVLRIK